MKSRFVLVRPAIAALALSFSPFVPAAFAQNTAPAAPPTRTSPAAAPRTATVLVSRILERLSTQNAVTAVADSTIAFERLPDPRAGDAAPITASPAAVSEAGMEKELNALVKTLPAGTVWVKLYLPTPATGKNVEGRRCRRFRFRTGTAFWHDWCALVRREH